jgi:hypothetical protein
MHLLPRFQTRFYTSYSPDEVLAIAKNPKLPKRKFIHISLGVRGNEFEGSVVELRRDLKDGWSTDYYPSMIKPYVKGKVVTRNEKTVLEIRMEYSTGYKVLLWCGLMYAPLSLVYQWYTLEEFESIRFGSLLSIPAIGFMIFRVRMNFFEQVDTALDALSELFEAGSNNEY